MTGTRKGALKSVKKHLAKDPEYFVKLAKRAKKPRGGKNAKGSFYYDRDLARRAGAKGGRISRRPPKQIDDMPPSVGYEKLESEK